MQRELAQELYDAMDRDVRGVLGKTGGQPLLVIITRYHERDGKPGTSGTGSTPRRWTRSTIRPERSGDAGGVPAGFRGDDFKFISMTAAGIGDECGG